MQNSITFKKGIKDYIAISRPYRVLRLLVQYNRPPSLRCFAGLEGQSATLRLKNGSDLRGSSEEYWTMD